MDLLVNIYLNNIKIFSAFLVGVGITAFFLYCQIKNRYVIGLNAGHLNGGFEFIDFLKKNIKKDSSKEITDYEKYLGFKDAKISVVRIETVVFE